MKKVAVGFCIAVMLLYSVGTIAGATLNGRITGRWITGVSGPMTGGQVLLFNAAAGPPPASNKYLRIPDAGTAVDSAGKFSVEVPAGKYYLVMRKRVNPESAGPPEEGDPQYYARFKNGKPRAYAVSSGKITDVGTITEAVPYKKEKQAAMEGQTGIEGTVTDDRGQPVAGVRVLAYGTPMVQGRPLYATEGTGLDGKYFINVNKPGTYYLKVRSRYGGGKPEAGEFMSGYGEQAAPAIVKVEKGEIIKGADITTTIFPGRGKQEE